jgi:hypothetical protein
LTQKEELTYGKTDQVSSFFSPQSVGLAAGATLKWLGFSWRGMVLIKDSNNVLKGLTHQFGWQWTTVFDFNAVSREHGAADWYADPPLLSCFVTRSEQQFVQIISITNHTAGGSHL